jgi:SAM-dependent methyltransferase
MNDPANEILRLGFGFAVSQALRVAAELKIADLLEKGERTVDDLAGEAGANAGALYRVLRLLASEGVFLEMSPRRFQQTDLSAALRSDAPRSPRDYIRMVNSEPYQAFHHLLHSVRTGEPAFERVFGAPRFAWLSAHPEQAELFQRAMIGIGAGANEAVAEACDYSLFQRIVDVGGGHGQLLSAILSRNPALSGVLFDLPAGIAAAATGIGGPLPRTELVAGDFFPAAPQGADAYIMKRVIHDWDDERAILILRNCRNAMRPGGKILIAETLVEAGNAPDLNKMLDVTMLAVTGGVERSEDQFAKLLTEAGLRLDRRIVTASSLSILEASAR